MNVTDKELIEKANFPVGACLLSADGRTFTGCNVENASLGATNCAERTAVFKAISEGVRDFVAIAVVAEKGMAWPCAICRQVLNEFASNIRVIVAYQDHVEEAPLSELLPHAFGPKDLNK